VEFLDKLEEVHTIFALPAREHIQDRTMHTEHDYQNQLDEKQVRLTGLLAEFQAPPLEVFPSEPNHYRMRAEFHIWHEGDDVHYIMFDKQTRARYRVETFLPAHARINALMPRVLEQLHGHPVLKPKLFQVDFLTTQHGETLISLLYHKKLGEDWEPAARLMRDALSAQGEAIHIVGRAYKRLTVQDQTLEYMQVENSFTQPNAGVNQQMLGWALDVTRNQQKDLLELYCGNGNFSLALARNFRHVLATEIAKASVASAQYNIQANHIDNVTILRMSAEEFTQAMNGEREFKRLRGITLSEYECDTVLVDPPRAGLDDATIAMIQKYDHIVYISCNPETLHANLQTLTQTHRIDRCALFDQFPFTHHIETGVWLVRR
jgi:tRNA (uracil-5-)-methyltransferase